MQPSNPLLQPWNTPYGLPPFDLIRTEHYAPALEVAMAEQVDEVEVIATSALPPTFANTIDAFDRCGASLSRVYSVFGNLTSNLTNEALQAVELEYSPKLAVHSQKFYLDSRLFARVDAVYNARHNSGLDEVQIRLVERLHLDFVLSGAKLDATKKARLAELVEQLSQKCTTFGQYVLADEDQTIIVFDSQADLAGLPTELIEAAAQCAKDHGHEGSWALTTSRSFVEPFLTRSSRRDLRKKVYDQFSARGEMHPERDTKPLIAQILKLRTEMAHIHGHQSFADYALVSRMAKNPANVADLLGQVWPAALKRSRQEQQLLLSVAKADGLTALEAWDWRYYAEKVRLRDYQLDDGEIKPYFTLDNMLQAMFYAAGRLYQVSFQEVTGTAPLYHPDARLFEMRRADGSLQGIFISDNYSRTGKHSGAWMSNYREQSEGVLPIVSNNNNFTRGKPGEPVLLSFDDVETLFHEFGHALHSLLSEVKYEGLSGTNVLQDFVELPSQLNEHWALAPEVLAKFAKHVDTGASIPPALVEKVRKARTFNMGWETVQYLGPALLDMALHSLGDANGFDAALFEREESQRLGVPSEIGLRHRLPHFQHLFTGEGYAAGYYVYMWAEVLEADVFSAFEEKGDLFDPGLSARLKLTLLSIGNSVDPAQAFRNFRGRDPQISALLKQRGLA